MSVDSEIITNKKIKNNDIVKIYNKSIGCLE